MLVLQVVIVLLLLIIFFEDMYSRSVHWFLFPLLALALGGYQWLSYPSISTMATHTLINLGFIALQLLLVSLYFSIKHQKLVNITAGLLGWGDVLLVLCLSCYLTPLAYIAFYILSLLLILLGWALYQLMSKTASPHIPLAGLQSLLFAGVLVYSWLNSGQQGIQKDGLFNLLSR